MSFFKKIWRPLVALLFLVVLVKKGPIRLEQIQLALSQPRILILGLALFFIQFILFAFRWKLFVDQFSHLEFKTAFKLTLIGQFFSFFIPGGVGGDVVKALELAKEHIASRSKTLSTVIADRVLGLFNMILFSSVFLTIEYFNVPFEQLNRYLTVSWGLLFLVTSGLLTAPYIVKLLNQFFDGKESKLLIHLNKLINSFSLTFESFRNFKLMLKNMVLCLAVQLITIFFMYSVVKNLNIQPPPFLIFFSLCCFGILASAIPLTPAGIGVGQAAFYFLFSTFSTEMAEASVTAVSLFQLFQLFFSVFGGFFFSIKSHSKQKIA